MCFLHVPTIGFAFDCDAEQETSINFGEELASDEADSAQLFTIEFNTIYQNASDSSLNAPFGARLSSSYLQMNLSYTSAVMGDGNLSCPGTQFSRNCRLWPAIVNYPVMIRNSSEAFTVSIGEQSPLRIEADTQNLGIFNQSGWQQNGRVVRLICHQYYANRDAASKSCSRLLSMSRTSRSKTM
jgi:hypothetical protein